MLAFEGGFGCGLASALGGGAWGSALEGGAEIGFCGFGRGAGSAAGGADEVGAAGGTEEVVSEGVGCIGGGALLVAGAMSRSAEL